MAMTMEDMNADATLSDADMASVGAARAFRIKCVGRRPMTFRGTELAMAMSFTPALPYWYEINLFRTTEQRFVVAIKLFHQSEDEKDTAQCWEADSLDEALGIIESYDASADVTFPGIDGADAMSAAECGAMAWGLRARVENARHHYAGLVGEFLHDLDSNG